MDLRAFFDEWDDLESANPFGVMRFQPLFVRYGVSEVMAADVDEFLFLDLMSRRHINIRRIKVQARLTDEIFWVYLDLRTSVLSFQATPMAPMTYSVTIDADPVWLVRFIMAYYCHFHRKVPPVLFCHRELNACRRRRVQ